MARHLGRSQVLPPMFLWEWSAEHVLCNLQFVARNVGRTACHAVHRLISFTVPGRWRLSARRCLLFQWPRCSKDEQLMLWVPVQGQVCSVQHASTSKVLEEAAGRPARMQDVSILLQLVGLWTFYFHPAIYPLAASFTLKLKMKCQ